MPKIQIVRSRRRRVVIAIVSLAMILLATLATATPAAAATLGVRFAAGPHTGYRFDPAGAITATKSATIARPSGASADARSSIPGRGVHLRVSTGLWAGYWIPESALAFVPGIAGHSILATPARVAFAAGTYLGYAFTTEWRLASAKRGTLASSSGAPGTERAVINGRRYIRIGAGIWAGRWMPLAGTSTATPSGVACRVGSKVVAGSPQTWSVLPGATNQVALTFDMGGRLEPALDILDVLTLERVCTTIFPTGAMAQTPVGQQILAVVRAHPELFEVGNHTMHHCNLRDGGGGSPTTAPCPTTRPSDAFARRELTDAAAIIAAGTGTQPAPYWRPPYGAIDSRLISAVAAAGYTKTMMWDVDTIDWRPVADGGPTAAFMANKVATTARNGSMVLMHLGGWNTKDALPSMIARLHGRGFLLDSISGILR